MTATSTAEVMQEARTKISFPDLGIEKTSLRRAQTGGVIIEVPGADENAKADLLATGLRELFAKREDVRIGRPIQRAELCLYSVDDSVVPNEVVTAVAVATGCDRIQVTVGPVRPTNRGRGLSTVWLSCPLSAANVLAGKGHLCVG